MGRAPLVALFYAAWLTIVGLTAVWVTTGTPDAGLQPVAGWPDQIVKPGAGLDQ